MADIVSTRDMLNAMLNKPLYVALRHPQDLTRMAALLPAHLKWAVQAEKRGELFASGPFASPDGTPGTAGGMSILRAASPEEAQGIMSSDPFIREGVFKVEVKKWILMEGSVTVTVHFSDQSSRVL